MAENLPHRKPGTPHTGFPEANCRVNTDAIKHCHNDMIEKSYLGCKILGQSQPRSWFGHDAEFERRTAAADIELQGLPCLDLAEPLGFAF